MRSQIAIKTICLFFYLLILSAGADYSWAADWPSWRGQDQNGVSSETGLTSTWSIDGENLIWKADFKGRSTPIVLNGRVYVIGRVGEKVTQQEQVACFDAETGRMLWEHRFNVFHTDIPFNRVGWASLAGDTETGNIYAHGVGGMFFCFNPDGVILWSRSLTEEFGRFSGYGGRTHTPVVDEGLVIVSFVNTSWGEQAVPGHRYFAFDKRTGQVVWISNPGGRPLDTTYSTPVVAKSNGQRLLIAGNADGAIYAMKVRTGEKVWGFQLSKGGINTSVVVDGTKVYAAHSEENIDNTVMGHVGCIDGTGAGDITKTHEIWRYDGCEVGYTAPVLHEGRIYVVDNSANLHCLDAGTGKAYWRYSLGTVGKGSPVWADGKLYATEVNGAFHILEPSENECKSLDVEKLRTREGRPAEIYGSPAVAYGRVYFTTEEELYCLGDKEAKFSMTSTVVSTSSQESVDRNSKPASLQVVPAEVLSQPGETVPFSVRTFDDKGRFLREVNAEWSLNGLSGTINAEGKFTPDKNSGVQVGTIAAKVGELKASSRVRVIPELPWAENFESIALDKSPAHWIGATNKFFVRNKEGNQVLAKPPVERGLQRSTVFFGPPTMKDYTIQADLMGTKNGRNLPDMGLIANRYTLDLMGNHQRLQIRSWVADLRMSKTVDFPWEPDVWYTMKLKVDIVGDKGVIQGKVWRTGDPEPEAWTITAEDPLPHREGSPGLYGYSAAEIYYDNLKVW